MKIKQIIKAEFTMLFGEIKQYYINYIFYNLSTLLLFFGLFFNFLGSDNGQTVMSTLICLVLWQICSNSLQYLCYVVQDEAMMGTLEQIFLTKTGFISILMAKTFVNMSFTIFKGLILFILCVFLFGYSKYLIMINLLEWLMILLIGIITTFAFYCIGAIFGGLSLYFKRIGSLLNVVDYFLLFFTGALNGMSSYPDWLNTILCLIPVTQANHLIYSICTGDFNVISLIVFIGTCFIYILLSLNILNRLIQKAKQMGKLGQY